MKIATFNIQNLFHRSRELIKNSHTKNAADWIDELDSLLRKQRKDTNDSNRIQDLSYLLGFEKIENLPYAILKRQAGELCYKHQGFKNSTKASFLTNWEGWVKLGNVPLNDKGIFSKAYMIAETNPDILILQEVEDRASLVEFNEEFLPLLKISPYQQVMVFETNDPRGLGMGILLKNGYRLNGFKNHLYDLDPNGFKLFDKDCQEYEVVTPDGQELLILSNQFSVKADQRKAQAHKVAQIYTQMQSDNKKSIIVCGTLNDLSYSDCLSPLLRDTDLKDISKHENFKADTDNGKDGSYFRLGAYRMGVNLEQKDYLLLSLNLFEKVNQGGINRKGTWPEHKPNWQLHHSIASKQHSASEHPLVWAEIIK